MPVYIQEYESYYPILYHPTPPAVLDDERAAPFVVPVFIQDYERF